MPIRGFIPKSVSNMCFFLEQLMAFADEMNSRPHRRLVNQTLEELFDRFLDRSYVG